GGRGGDARAAYRAARGVRGRAPCGRALPQAPAPGAPSRRGAPVRPGADRGLAQAPVGERARGAAAMNEEEPFLKRWSRRKAEARDGREPAVPDADAVANAAQPERAEPHTDGHARAGGDGTGERQLTEADFADVDFDALDARSDYSRFLAKGVPDSIKYKALRKLWASDPVFTTPDPFQDYLHDYTDAAVAVPPGTLKTANRIGKGFLTDEEAAEWDKLGKPAEAQAAAAHDPSSVVIAAE